MSTLRRVGLTQLLGSTADGIVLSTAVVYFTTRVGIPEAVVGAVLASAAAVSLVLSVPLGTLTDRIGLRRSALIASTGVAVALVVYGTATSAAQYALGALLFVVTQSWIGAVRQAIVSSSLDGSERVRGRAILHTLLNGGLGLGTVIGTIVVAVGARGLFVGAYALGAAGAVACALVFLSLPRPSAPPPSVAETRRPGLVAFRDRRFIAIVGLFSIVQITMPTLSVLLPVWIATRTGAPDWVAPVALGLNTVLVIATQTAWAARVRTDAAAVASVALAAVALLLACAAFGLAGSVAPIVLLIAGVVLLTTGEIAAGAGTWHAAFRAIPDAAHGRYQATFGMAASVARILGSGAALPLVTGLGGIGWGVLGVAMALAAGGIAVVARR